MVEGLSRISPHSLKQIDQVDCLSSPRDPEEIIQNEDGNETSLPYTYGREGAINPSLSASDEVESWEDPYERADKVLSL